MVLMPGCWALSSRIKGSLSWASPPEVRLRAGSFFSLIYIF
jgi:hypothetical protein